MVSMVKRIATWFLQPATGSSPPSWPHQHYTGIKNVLETPYGGFISTFGNGGKQTPPTAPERITNDLGKTWELQAINVKPYASMAATHGTIDCIMKIRSDYPDAFSDIDLVDQIVVESSEPAFKKGGWAPKRPTDSTSAQMSAPYAAASQIVDNSVLVAAVHASLARSRPGLEMGGQD